MNDSKMTFNPAAILPKHSNQCNHGRTTTALSRQQYFGGPPFPTVVTFTYITRLNFELLE